MASSLGSAKGAKIGSAPKLTEPSMGRRSRSAGRLSVFARKNSGKARASCGDLAAWDHPDEPAREHSVSEEVSSRAASGGWPLSDGEDEPTAFGSAGRKPGYGFVASALVSPGQGRRRARSGGLGSRTSSFAGALAPPGGGGGDRLRSPPASGWDAPLPVGPAGLGPAAPPPDWHGEVHVILFGVGQGETEGIYSLRVPAAEGVGERDAGADPAPGHDDPIGASTLSSSERLRRNLPRLPEVMGGAPMRAPARSSRDDGLGVMPFEDDEFARLDAMAAELLDGLDGMGAAAGDAAGRPAHTCHVGALAGLGRDPAPPPTGGARAGGGSRAPAVRETIVSFESRADAERYAQRLATCISHAPTVWPIAWADLLEFCEAAGHGCRFESRNSPLLPPEFAAGPTDWERSLDRREDEATAGRSAPRGGVARRRAKSAGNFGLWSERAGDGVQASPRRAVDGVWASPGRAGADDAWGPAPYAGGDAWAASAYDLSPDGGLAGALGGFEETLNRLGALGVGGPGPCRGDDADGLLSNDEAGDWQTASEDEGSRRGGEARERARASVRAATRDPSSPRLPRRRAALPHAAPGTAPRAAPDALPAAGARAVGDDELDAGVLGGYESGDATSYGSPCGSDVGGGSLAGPDSGPLSPHAPSSARERSLDRLLDDPAQLARARAQLAGLWARSG